MATAAGFLRRHAPALLGASLACFGAFAAMVHVVFFAFGFTRLADLGAEPADLGAELTRSRHVAGGEAANRGSIDVQRDATHKCLRIGLLQACGGAVVTGDRAGVAGFNTAGESFVGHRNLLSKEVV